MNKHQEDIIKMITKFILYRNIMWLSANIDILLKRNELYKRSLRNNLYIYYLHSNYLLWLRCYPMDYIIHDARQVIFLFKMINDNQNHLKCTFCRICTKFIKIRHVESAENIVLMIGFKRCLARSIYIAVLASGTRARHPTRIPTDPTRHRAG